MNRCPVGPSYAMAFAVTIHVQIRHVRFPAVPLGFGATGACLLLTHGGPILEVGNSNLLRCVTQSLRCLPIETTDGTNRHRARFGRKKPTGKACEPTMGRIRR